MTTARGISRRTFLKGAAGLAGATVLEGCTRGRGGEDAADGRPKVRVVSWTSLGYPSPFTYTAGPGYWRMSLLFDTLTWPDATGTQLPWLASSYTRSDDGLVYTVDLRDVAWDDGRPLLASDVAFTYRYYTSQIFTPLLIGIPRKGADVAVTGDRRVEFRLERPDATFVQQVLGTMPIVPEHVFSAIADPMAVMDKRVLMGTGAYWLASRSESKDTESYVAKDRYFLGPPYVRRIEMVPAANDDPLAALRVGVLDGANSPAEGVRNDVLAPFRDNPAYGMVSREAGFAFPLFFNLRRGGPLADVRFRRACLHAIDRQDIVDRLLTGNGGVGSAGWLPPSNPYYDAGVRAYPFDRAEAVRLLDEAGYRRAGGGNRVKPDGSPLRYVLHVPDLVPVALAELLAANLEAVGIGIELQRIDLVHLLGTKVQASYDLLVTSYPGPSGVGPEGDPELLRGVFHSSPPNAIHSATGYANPEVDRLIDAQLAARDLDERKRLVGRIQQLVAEDLPVAMLYYTKFFFAYRKKVFDQWYYTPGGFGPGMPDVYNKHAYIVGRKEGLEVRR